MYLGGIRCEKASAYLLKKGFENVHQLDGGMVSYMEQYPAQNFLGAMYTFDNRHVMDYDGGNHEKYRQVPEAMERSRRSSLTARTSHAWDSI